MGGEGDREKPSRKLCWKSGTRRIGRRSDKEGVQLFEKGLLKGLAKLKKNNRVSKREAF